MLEKHAAVVAKFYIVPIVHYFYLIKCNYIYFTTETSRSLEAAFYVSVAVRVCLSFLQFNLNVAVSNQVISQLESNSILFTRQSPFKLVFGAWRVSILEKPNKKDSK